MNTIYLPEQPTNRRGNRIGRPRRDAYYLGLLTESWSLAKDIAAVIGAKEQSLMVALNRVLRRYPDLVEHRHNIGYRLRAKGDQES